MSQLATTTMGSHYTDEQRMQAAVEYSVSGSILKTADIVKIPSRTLYDWSHSEWWQSEVARLRKENKDLFNAQYTNIIKDGLEEIHDRVKNGDAYVTNKGKIKRKPASLRDLGTVTGIAFDKLRLLNNEPTSITDNSAGKLQELMKQFEQITHAKVIDGEVIDNKEQSPKLADSE